MRSKSRKEWIPENKRISTESDNINDIKIMSVSKVSRTMKNKELCSKDKNTRKNQEKKRVPKHCKNISLKPKENDKGEEEFQIQTKTNNKKKDNFLRRK